MWNSLPSHLKTIDDIHHFWAGIIWLASLWISYQNAWPVRYIPLKAFKNAINVISLSRSRFNCFFLFSWYLVTASFNFYIIDIWYCDIYVFDITVYTYVLTMLSFIQPFIFPFYIHMTIIHFGTPWNAFYTVTTCLYWVYIRTGFFVWFYVPEILPYFAVSAIALFQFYVINFIWCCMYHKIFPFSLCYVQFYLCTYI